jgi:hypothetical protein
MEGQLLHAGTCGQVCALLDAWLSIAWAAMWAAMHLILKGGRSVSQ